MAMEVFQVGVARAPAQVPQVPDATVRLRSHAPTDGQASRLASHSLGGAPLPCFKNGARRLQQLLLCRRGLELELELDGIQEQELDGVLEADALLEMHRTRRLAAHRVRPPPGMWSPGP